MGNNSVIGAIVTLLVALLILTMVGPAILYGLAVIASVLVWVLIPAAILIGLYLWWADDGDGAGAGSKESVREAPRDHPGTQPSEPDWYRDPRGIFTHRYWNGERWTKRIAVNGVSGTSPVGEAEPEARETQARLKRHSKTMHRAQEAGTNPVLGDAEKEALGGLGTIIAHNVIMPLLAGPLGCLGLIVVGGLVIGIPLGIASLVDDPSQIGRGVRVLGGWMSGAVSLTFKAILILALLAALMYLTFLVVQRLTRK